MRVWIDQDLCTGDGLCTDHCPELFVLLEDGISYVIGPAGEALNDPGGSESLAPVPDAFPSRSSVMIWPPAGWSSGATSTDLRSLSGPSIHLGVC